MKLYNFPPALNGKRVLAFLNEKKIKIEIIELNVRSDDQFKEPYLSMNPFNCIPFLELKNGKVIAESISICRYLDQVYPDNPLFGSNPEDSSIIDMWSRRLELDGLAFLGHAIRNKLPFFKGKVLPGTRNEINQSSDIVERGTQAIHLLFERIDPCLKNKKFICGDNFSIADITGYFIFKTCEALEINILEKYENVGNWKQKLYERSCFEIE